MENKILLQLDHVTKEYPGVVALDDLSMSIEEGEIHAIAGENGAGKSTMMKLISGAIEPTAGTITFDGVTYDAMETKLARELGIEVVYQEFNLVDSMSVAENMFLNTYPGGQFPNFREIHRRAKEILTDMGVHIDPSTKVGDLSTAYCQLVEIAKALTKNVRLLILDEPTAALTVAETDILFRLVRELKEKGTTILYVSHRMSEIFDLCDRVTVFRDGKYISTMKTAETDRDHLISQMVGRDISDESYPERYPAGEEVVLSVKHLSGMGVQDISFDLHKGEILGFAGLVGAGRTETVRMIFGADKIDKGEIYVDGQKVNIHNPEDACAVGIGFVPEDRKTQGVALNLSIKDNIALPILKNVSKHGFVNYAQLQKLIDQYKDALSIKAPSMNQFVKNLSGGNQQKVVLSKWLAKNCKVLIVDEPTRGIDVGAKQEIYKILNDLARDGVAIIMVSSEMPELIGMADRILVLSEGHATGILDRAEFDQEVIMKYSSREY